MPQKINFHDLIRYSLRYADLTQLEDLVYVLGDSGIGKSTLIAYLAGFPLIYVKLQGRLQKVLMVENIPDGVAPPTIGQQVESETLLPTIYRHFNHHLLYVDFPGFHGNRDKETGLLEFLATQVAIKTTQSVKAVVMLMSYSLMFDARDSHIISVFEQMADLGPVMPTSIQIMISHLPEINPPCKSDIISSLRRTLEFMQHKLETENSPKNQRIADLLYWFTEGAGKRQIILFNPLSNKTRERLLQLIQPLPSFSPTLFNLVGHEQIKNEFQGQLQKIYDAGKYIFSTILSNPQNKTVLTTQLDQHIHHLKQIDFDLSIKRLILSNTSRVFFTNSPILAELEKRMHGIKVAINMTNIRWNQVTKEMADISNKIDDLNRKNEIILYHKIEWHQIVVRPFNKPHSNPLRQTGVVIEWNDAPYNYSTTKIGYRCLSGEYGRWHSDENPSTGHYRATYYPPEKCLGQLIVEFYMEYKNQPTKRNEIMLLKELLATETNNAVKLKETLKKYTSIYDTMMIASQSQREKLIAQQKAREAFAIEQMVEDRMIVQQNIHQHHRTRTNLHDINEQALNFFHQSKLAFRYVTTLIDVIGLNTTEAMEFQGNFTDVCTLLKEPMVPILEMPWQPMITNRSSTSHIAPYSIEPLIDVPSLTQANSQISILSSIENGAVRGLSTVVTNSLKESNRTTEAIAQIAGDLLYHGWYFYRQTTMHLAANEPALEAYQKAAIETVQMFTVTKSLQLLDNVGKKIQQRNIPWIGRTLSFFSKTAPFAYSIKQQGVIETMANVAIAASTQEFISATLTPFTS